MKPKLLAGCLLVLLADGARSSAVLHAHRRALQPVLCLRGMPDAPNIGERRGEIATYLERAR